MSKPTPDVRKLDPKHDGQSLDLVRENIAALKSLFPEIVSDGKVDFEVLRTLLGDEVDAGDERYGLNWLGKQRARLIAQQPSTGTLRPCPEESVNWDTTQNLFIEGDNLEVLKLLQKAYHSRVDVIYIDPPYNRTGDRIYHDDFEDNLRSYLRFTGQVSDGGLKLGAVAETNGRYHTNWLTMLLPRLRIARPLLKDAGIILVSIDDKELHNLRHLLDEVFGAENYLGTIVWKGATDNNPTQIAIEHEYLVCYTKVKGAAEGIWKNPSDATKRALLTEFERLRGSKLLPDADALQRELRSFIRRNRESLGSVTHYDRVDSRGIFTGSRKVHNPKPGGYVYDIIHPVTNRACAMPVNGYRYPKQTMDALIAEDRLIYGDDETQIVQIKEYLEDFEGKLSSVLSLDSRTGANELNEMFGVQKVFSNPKPVGLLKDIFEFVLARDAIIVDFFAGSGTTAHAVWRLNEADQGTRRFVLIQLPEVLDPTDKDQKPGSQVCDALGKPRTIAELTKERLRRAPATLTRTPSDIGFKVFKLDSSNLKAWDGEPERFTNRTLDDAVDHIKPGRTNDDLLYELLLKLGLDLASPIERREIQGAEVQVIGAGALVVCLQPNLALEVIDGIAALKAELTPEVMRVVFRDACFADDVTKANAVQILRHAGVDDIQSL